MMRLNITMLINKLSMLENCYEKILSILAANLLHVF